MYTVEKKIKGNQCSFSAKIQNTLHTDRRNHVNKAVDYYYRTFCVCNLKSEGTKFSVNVDSKKTMLHNAHA